MSQVSDTDLKDNSKFSILISRYDPMQDYTRVKFQLESKQSRQKAYVSSSITTDEIAALSSQTQQAVIKAAFVKIKDSVKTIAKELEERCVYLGQEYFGTVDTD